MRESTFKTASKKGKLMQVSILALAVFAMILLYGFMAWLARSYITERYGEWVATRYPEINTGKHHPLIAALNFVIKVIRLVKYRCFVTAFYISSPITIFTDYWEDDACLGNAYPNEMLSIMLILSIIIGIVGAIISVMISLFTPASDFWECLLIGGTIGFIVGVIVWHAMVFLDTVRLEPRETIES